MLSTAGRPEPSCQQVSSGGRRGVGTTNHCMHGPEAIVEEILDWRRFDYFTDRSTMPGGPKMLSTFEPEPTPTGTRVHVRFGRPTKFRGRGMLEGMRQELLGTLRAGGESLRSALAGEVEARVTDAAEPPLPAPRPDGVLAGVQPLRYVS